VGAGRGAGPARGEAYQKKGRQGGKWRGVALLWRQAPPLLWWPMYAVIAARRQAQPPASAPPCVCEGEGERARVAKPPWQPRDDEHSRERGRGPLLLAEGGEGALLLLLQRGS
jgi:hypothetical protein